MEFTDQMQRKTSNSVQFKRSMNIHKQKNDVGPTLYHIPKIKKNLNVRDKTMKLLKENRSVSS